MAVTCTDMEGQLTVPLMRARFDLVWPAGHVVLPVAHVTSIGQALRNTQRAVAASADGVFLISHDGDDVLLNETIAEVRAQHPGLWIGANYLTDPGSTVVVVDPGLDGIWVDDALIVEGADDQTAAAGFAARLRAVAPGALLFGGVAFKYGRPVRDVAGVARCAAPIFEVVTTSGAATGEAAPLDKMRSVRAGVGTAAVGLASGATPENVADYLDLVDVFLVATGVSDTFTELNQDLLTEFVATVHSARPA